MIPIPLNALVFLQYFTNLARFDWFGPVDYFDPVDYSSIFTYYTLDPKDGQLIPMKEDLVGRLSEMGYEGHSSLHNLSVVRFFVFLNLLRLGLYPIALLMLKNRPNSLFWKQVSTHLRRFLF
jgi:hypothetical protein